MIEVKNISKKFNNNVVLNGIDLNINKGDVVAIIGPSGTGKSTFLRCLNRLEKPESGSISIGDLSVDLARSDKKSLVELRKKTSMVFQGFNLFSKKTAYTMLLVSHEMNFVKNVATRVIFLENGKIIEDGPPKEVFNHPKSDRVREFFAKINRMVEPEYSI